MAKLSKVMMNERRRKLVAQYAKKRAELKEIIRKPTSSDEDREMALRKLNGLPRNSNAVRIRNRCRVTGRSRGYYRKFELSRISLRDLGLAGKIPGLTKSSW
ncbi:MAG: 30S ribosomal protein S14 [Deltaproteobacteria bacterium]|nr:30S ribosomal protein S14 [Deltaproteobacteria bacterium]